MIKIICLGKIKEQYWRDAIDEYQKRLSKYTTIQIIELPDEKTDDKIVALRLEKERVLKKINPKDYIVLLDIQGEEYSSVEFAKKLDSIFNINSNITFIIGSSYGVDDDIKKVANLRISFSKMTFAHQMFRVILLEQIYRAFKINNNETYHK